MPPSSEPGAGLRAEIAIIAAVTALSLAISWPLPRDFTTALTGSGLDALADLWSTWHTAQAVAGREPLFSTSLLYYPTGISLRLQSVGPFAAVLALPFWPLGPIAAHNGGLLVGLILTGVAMYALARELGCSRPASLVAGVILLSAPVHLVGLRGHMAKVFLGLMPLALLVLRRALDARRSPAWCGVFGGLSLLLILHSPFQFVQVALIAPLVVLAAILGEIDRGAIVRRSAWAALAALAFAGPQLAAIVSAGADPAVVVDRRSETASHQPDALQLVLPPSFSQVFGDWTSARLATRAIRPEIETEVAVPLMVVLLCLVATIKDRRRSLIWITIASAGVVLSLGPTLRVAGSETGVPLPYAWIAALPGLDFLRTPSRFLQIGFVGLAAAAGLGVSALVTTRRREWTLAAIAIGAVLFETWPKPWPTLKLPPVPGLYTALARDGEQYGVLDLPLRPLPHLSPMDYSARYQALQMTHGKGIAGGYVSRGFERHPIAPCLFAEVRAALDVRVNGTPSQCEPAAIHQLASSNYRYVVWHQPSRDVGPDRDSFAARDAESFVTAAFAGRRPDIDDGVIRAWRLPPPDEALPTTPVLELTSGWHEAEPNWRWARTPAQLRITSAIEQQVTLVLAVALIHGLGTPVGLAQEGVLIVTIGSATTSLAIKPGEAVRVPVTIARGVTNVTLSLGAGNFSPADYGQDDRRTLSVAFESIDLVTTALTTLQP